MAPENGNYRGSVCYVKHNSVIQCGHCFVLLTIVVIWNGLPNYLLAPLSIFYKTGAMYTSGTIMSSGMCNIYVDNYTTTKPTCVLYDLH